ncbi:hypothetical protein CF319_g8131 [Tilletia indica]|nr:hypothetical protein CF319_g8131 [Tilletia indica]
MAPELLAGGQGRAYDEAVDAWALGITLYEVCTGQIPFMLANGLLDRKSLIAQHIPAPSLPANFFPELRLMVSQLLRKDPRLRLRLRDGILKPQIQLRQMEKDNSDLRIQLNQAHAQAIEMREKMAEKERVNLQLSASLEGMRLTYSMELERRQRDTFAHLLRTTQQELQQRRVEQPQQPQEEEQPQEVQRPQDQQPEEEPQKQKTQERQPQEEQQQQSQDQQPQQEPQQ